MKELMSRIDRMLPRKSPRLPETQSGVQSPREDLTKQTEPNLSESMKEHTVASAFALMLLEENLRKGGTVEIPSLGIVLTKDNLKNNPIAGKKSKVSESENTLPSNPQNTDKS